MSLQKSSNRDAGRLHEERALILPSLVASIFSRPSVLPQLHEIFGLERSSIWSIIRYSSSFNINLTILNSLPLNVPEQPAFGRETFQHQIKVLADGYAYDDPYVMNTQSGTQWDGFRHFAYFPTAEFYNGWCERR